MRFKQICNHPSQWLGDGAWAEEDSGKLARLRDIAEEIAARQEKALVFTQFRETTAPLAAFLGSVFGRPGLVLHGETEVGKRKDLVRRFQEDEDVPFFVLSLKAGGAGLNLTAASHVIHFDRWWNPAVENQATDRAFRIGQTKNVLVHKFVCRGTVEDKIDQMIESKQQLAGDFLGGGAEMLLTEMKDDELLEARGARPRRGDEGGLTDELAIEWRPYVPVAAAAAAGRSASSPSSGRRGDAISPVTIEGRNIATSFWGQSWCSNLERYSDFANRLPRGRTYVRNGSVLDLQIAKGEVAAMVSGSELYKIKIGIAPVAARAGRRSAGIAREHRFAGRAAAGPPRQGRDGPGVPGGRRPVSGAERDQALVQLPGLGRHVQARGGGALRRRRAPRRAAAAAVRAARRR